MSSSSIYRELDTWTGGIEQMENLAEEATMSDTEYTSRWVLYHGTTSRRLKSILAEGILRHIYPSGDPKLSMTTERSVAEYFACNSLFGDRRDYPGEDSEPVVLVLDGERLVELRYELEAFSDPVWGEGACDWENEIACWSDIPLDDVLIDVDTVSADRQLDYQKGGPAAFMPPSEPTARRMLSVMRTLVDNLEVGNISPEDADEFFGINRERRRAA